jgi:beta-lactamase class A
MRRRSRLALLVLIPVWSLLGAGAAIARAAGGHPAARTHAARAAHAASARPNGNPFASAALRRWLRGRDGRITAAVYDIDTGREYLYQPQYAEKTASTVKVDILATALHQAQLAHHPLPANEAAAAVPMITQSDNDAASDLYDDIGGWSAIGPFDESIGMTRTTPNDEGYFGETFTTAADQITLLKQIMLPGGELSPASRRYEYELMRHVIPSQRWGITGGVPAGARVAIKNGWLPETTGWHVNSIGRVQGDDRDYLIAVYTEWDPSWDYGIDSIEQVAAAAWKAMGVKHGASAQFYSPSAASDARPGASARRG